MHATHAACAVTHVICVVQNGAWGLKEGRRALPDLPGLLGIYIQHAAGQQGTQECCIFTPGTLQGSASQDGLLGVHNQHMLQDSTEHKSLYVQHSTPQDHTAQGGHFGAHNKSTLQGSTTQDGALGVCT